MQICPRQTNVMKWSHLLTMYLIEPLLIQVREEKGQYKVKQGNH